MRADLHFAAAFPEVFDQFFAGFELGAGRLVAVEIADETNPEADVVHVIAVDVAAAHLPDPALTDLNLPVPRRSAVADDKLIGEPVPHPADVAMIVIENARASLARPAVVDDDEFPAVALDRRAADRVDVRGGEVKIVRRLPREGPPTAVYRRRGGGGVPGPVLVPTGVFRGG